MRWDDAGVDWAAYDLAVVRSCWDYAWRLEEFLAWAASVPRLRNPVEVLRWNTDKTYLRELERAGLPVVPTVWNPSERGRAARRGGVGGQALDLGRLARHRAVGRPGDVLAHVAELVAAGRTAMVQPYLASVDDVGETAMLFLGGAFSHAVRKGPLLERGEGVRQDRNSRGDLSPAVPTTAQRDAAAGGVRRDPRADRRGRRAAVRPDRPGPGRRGPAGAAGARAQRAQPVPAAGPGAAATLVRAVEAELSR